MSCITHRLGWVGLTGVCALFATVSMADPGQMLFEQACQKCHRNGLPACTLPAEEARAWLAQPGRPHRFTLNEEEREALLEYWRSQSQTR